MKIVISETSRTWATEYDDADGSIIANFFSNLLVYMKMYVVIDDIDPEKKTEIKNHIGQFPFFVAGIWPSDDLIITERDFEEDDNKCWRFTFENDFIGERKPMGRGTRSAFDKEILDITQFCRDNETGLKFNYDTRPSTSRGGETKADRKKSDREFELTIKLARKRYDASLMQQALQKKQLCAENDYDNINQCVTDLISFQCLNDKVFLNTSRQNSFKYCYNEDTVDRLKGVDPFTQQQMVIEELDLDLPTKTKIKQYILAKALIAQLTKPRWVRRPSQAALTP